MNQKDAVASLHKSLGIGKRAARPAPAAKRREIQAGQVQSLQNVLADIRRRARETPAWANAYNSAATAVELEIAAVTKGAARAAAPVSGQGASREAKLYVECRECYECGHKGINDDGGKLATCNTCSWRGNSPVEDKCPGCKAEGTMMSGCPKCGADYSLVADASLPVSIDSRPRSEDSRAKVLEEAADLLDEVGSKLQTDEKSHDFWMGVGAAVEAGEKAFRALASSASDNAPELGNAFITLESSGGEGGTIVLKFNQRSDAYAVHELLLKGGGQDYSQSAVAAAPEPTIEAIEHGTLKREAFVSDAAYGLYVGERGARERSGEVAPFAWIIVRDSNGEHDGGTPMTDKDEADDYMENSCLPGWHLEPIFRAAPAAPQAPARELTDAAMLNFVLENDAFLSKRSTDAGGTSYQLVTQNEDEEYIELSGDDKFFPSARAAVRAAIERHLTATPAPAAGATPAREG